MAVGRCAGNDVRVLHVVEDVEVVRHDETTITLEVAKVALSNKTCVMLCIQLKRKRRRKSLKLLHHSSILTLHQHVCHMFVDVHQDLLRVHSVNQALA